MASESASGPWELWPAVLRRPASIFTCLDHVSLCAYPMCNVSVYCCMLVYFIYLIIYAHSLEWIATLMAFPAYRSFGGWSFPLKCGTSALRPAVCVYYVWSWAFLLVPVKGSIWLSALLWESQIHHWPRDSVWVDYLSCSIWFLSPKSSQTAARMSCVRNVSVFFSHCWE